MESSSAGTSRLLDDLFDLLDTSDGSTKMGRGIPWRLIWTRLLSLVAGDAEEHLRASFQIMSVDENWSVGKRELTGFFEGLTDPTKDDDYAIERHTSLNLNPYS